MDSWIIYCQVRGLCCYLLGRAGNSNFGIHHDWDRLLSLVGVGYELKVIEESLFLYRIFARSLSHGTFLDDELNFRHCLFNKHRKLYQESYEFVIKAT